MNNNDALKILEELNNTIIYLTSNKELNQGDLTILQNKIPELYGMVEDIYKGIVHNLRVEVPMAGTGNKIMSKFPNYFEAGYLSGRTYHRHEGKMELMKVIGVLKGKAKSAIKANTITTKNKLLNNEAKLKLKQEIAEGNIKDVIFKLIKEFEELTPIVNELFLFYSQYEEITKKEITDTETPEVIKREKNRINKGVFEFIDRV